MAADSGSSSEAPEEFVCKHCKKAIVRDKLSCSKCKNFYHPGCVKLAVKTECINEFEKEEVFEQKSASEIEIRYQKILIDELISKNNVVMENNRLLVKKIVRLEEQLKLKSNASIVYYSSDNSEIPPVETVQEKWTTVTNKKKEKNNAATIKGTATGGNIFGAADSLAWFYVGKVNATTNCQQIQEYLMGKFPNETFKVEEIQKHEQNTSKNKSFKVGFNFKIKCGHKVRLQKLLDHTSQRLFEIQNEVLVQTLEHKPATSSLLLQLECKWGLDGSSSHSMYKQKFSSENFNTSDADILLSLLVPLRLHFKNKDNDQTVVVWQNPRCSSTRFCRKGVSTTTTKFFECILHLSYRLDIKKWQVRGSNEEKAAFEERKKSIISALKSELGLLVNVVKQGYGNTNDRNTFRRFFEDSTKASEITRVDETRIRRFSVILQALSSGYYVDVDQFRNYTLETVKLYVRLYP
ncbi:unnamed protein product [Brassicogethes aeneus]|uniref:Uncharacterized protein n=1 Tax=Brassicogethes aeneus TaxID=1431903 RepID=A0A9P0FMC8_BRAAE|nr:unnamed protein product [Brassicogethes aeneus]